MGVKQFCNLSSGFLSKKVCGRSGKHCCIWTRRNTSFIAGRGMWGEVQLSGLLSPSKRKTHQSNTLGNFRVRQKALCILAQFCLHTFAMNLGNHIIITLAAQ